LLNHFTETISAITSIIEWKGTSSVVCLSFQVLLYW
jgi:hypothetical protein